MVHAAPGPARPYRPVSLARLQATRLRLQEQLRQWCLDWGIAASHFHIEVQPYARGASLAAAGLPVQGWHAAGTLRWVWSVPPDALERAMRDALFGPLDTDSGLAKAGVAAALKAFDPALSEARDAAAAARLPTSGENLVLIALKSGAEDLGSLLALVQPASEVLAPRAAEGLPALRGVDLDAALRRLPARPHIEVGHTELALAELLDLRPAQVVVLDRSIHEPLRLGCADCSAEIPVHLGRIGDSFAVQAARAHHSAHIHSKETMNMSNSNLPPKDGAGKPVGTGGHVQMVDLEELSAAQAGGLPVIEDRLSLFGGIKARVTAVVGHAQTSVGELLALKEGTSFKLDRHVDAPIDLMVEGRVIARGQLSVLDDQFAVHVTEVIQAGAIK